MVGEATDGIEALERLAEGIDVDLILTDINMPQLNGLALIDEIKKKAPHIKSYNTFYPRS